MKHPIDKRFSRSFSLRLPRGLISRGNKGAAARSLALWAFLPRLFRAGMESYSHSAEPNLAPLFLLLSERKLRL